MIDIKELEHLAPMANEMLSGLHADEAMKRRILSAAREEQKPRVKAPWLVPALCCAALAIACAGVFAPRLSGTARVRAAGGGSESLFASASGDIPLVAVNGAVYRMLSAPTSVRGDLLGSAVGTVNTATDEPSLADDDAMAGGLSNVAEAGQTIYAVSGLDAGTAVACEVSGSMRLFQRVSYAGKGPGGQGLEDTFSVRGQVAELTLSGVGTLTGEAANDAVATLLDHATLKSADMSAKKQTLTATLTNGLKLQLGVSGDTVSACGGWSCPEFFEAFESSL